MPSHFLHLNLISSINGLCKSNLPKPFPLNSSSSLTLPTTTISSHSEHFQIGSGVPQYLLLDSAQSRLFFSHSPILPSLMCSGIQLTESLFLSSSFLTAVVRKYHEIIA